MLKQRWIGICGGSASGKTSFSKTLNDHLQDCTILSQDNYNHSQVENIKTDPFFNFDVPAIVEWELLASQMQKLKNNESVSSPIYDFNKHDRSEKTKMVHPHTFMILEGTMIFQDKKIVSLLDDLIFIDTKKEIRLERRLVRDQKERGRPAEEIKKSFEKNVQPMHEKYVEPYKKTAHLVLNGELSLEEMLKTTKDYLLAK